MDQLQGAVDEALLGNERPRVLEAGCGSAAHVRFPVGAHITGIDIDRRQLAGNTSCSEKVLGDIETYDLAPSSYDAIVCWYVLEHLKFPDHALVRFARAVKPGGIVVLAVPNLMTVKGLVTRHRPRSGPRPWPSTLPWTIVPDRLLRLAASCHLEAVFEAYLEDGKQVETRLKIGLTGRRWEAVKRLVTRLSRGRVDAARTELLLVLRRPVDPH
ncbi:MAG: class I SAM-dependent methyltransferase [Actinomycetes bacterium]